MSTENLPLDEFEEEIEEADDGPGELQRAVEVMRPPTTAKELEGISEVPVEIAAVIGHAMMSVGDLVALQPGTMIQLDRRVGQPIDIHVNNRLVARGEAVVVEEKLGISMTEVIKNEQT
ncbi:MAG: flagellar motor switch protein FliN [Pseudomonadota bacterium]